MLITEKVKSNIVSYLTKRHMYIVKLFLYKIDDWSLSRLGLQRKDYEQELYIVLQTSVECYLDEVICGERDDFCALSNYLFKGIRNEWVDIIRTLRRRKKSGVVFMDFVEDEDAQLKIELASVDAFKDEAIYLTWHECIFEGIDLYSFLSIKQRRIFRKFLMGWKVRQIALLYNMPEGSVLTIINQCRKYIKRGLDNLKIEYPNMKIKKT